MNGALTVKRSRPRKRFSPSRFLTHVILTLWGVTTVYPFIWVVLNSFRVKGQIRSDSFSIPWPWLSSFTFNNYQTATGRSDFANAYLNSFAISVTVTVLVVLLAGLAAYGLVRYIF
jgi:raffinose/stachyose/melibiose transport system permease protein